jgi:hypothetical protein
MDNGKAIALLVVGLMLASALADLASAFPASRGLPDNADSEPNETVAQATNITLATANIPGTLNGADATDIYKIWLTNTGANADTVTVLVNFNNSNGVSLTVTDSGGFLYFQGFDKNADNKVLKFVSGYTEFFYINISKQFSDFSYTLSTTKVNGAFQGNNNNYPTQSQTVTGDNQPINGNLDPVTPKDHNDFYKITLSSSSSAADLLVVFLKQPSNADFWVQLYKSLGGNSYQMIKQSKASIPGANVTLSYGATTTGDLYIRVFAWSGTGVYNVYIQKTSIHKGIHTGYATALPIVLTGNHTWSNSSEVGEGINPENWYSLPVVMSQFVNVSINSQDYSSSTKRPNIFISLLRTDHLTDYSNPNQTKSQADPLGYTNGSSPDSSGLNYIQVYVYGGGGGGRYSLSLVTDRPPVLKNSVPGIMTILENTFNDSLNVKSIFMDPDSPDTLTYSYLKGAGSAGFKDNANLSVTIAVDGKVTITPKAGNPDGWVGTGTVTLRARDPYGLNYSVNVLLNVKAANHAPFVKAPYNATMSILPPMLLTYADTALNGSIDLKKVFGDNDTGQMLGYNITMDNPVWIKSQYTTVLGKQVLLAATINDSIRISFTMETDLVTYKGPIVVYITTNATNTKLNHDATVYLWAIDNGDPPQKSHPVKLQIMVRKPAGNAPVWKTTFTKVQFAEDNSTTVNLDDYITDKDLADQNQIKYNITNYSNNLTVTQKDRNHFLFGAKTDWYGQVNDIKVMATDTFGLTANATIQVVVTLVMHPPKEDTTKTSPPRSQTVTVDEHKSVNLTVGVSDRDRQPSELKYEWRLDGTVIPGAVNQTYQYTPNYGAAGTHKLSVKVTDPTVTTYSFEAAWNVTVNHVNQKPTNVKILGPVNNFNTTEGAKIDFKAQTASDPDKDTLTYTWLADGTPMPGGTGQTFSYSKLKPGKHTITLEVNDQKGGVVSVSIAINVKKKPVKGFLPSFEGVTVLVALVAVGLVLLRKRR